MATHQEHYSLRWNNHQNHILRAFDTLLQTKTLVDVTLVCAETSIRAHKVVLSACSPFFQRVFSETPCKHPVIVLKDFRGWVVQAIVDFMYRGEISVPQERLQTLIQAGESLQVRGLVDHPVTGNTPTPAASPDEFSMLEESMEPHTFADTAAIVNSTVLQQKMLLPQAFVDPAATPNNQQPPQTQQNHEICTSPIPRRKQARPRRRSGECAPQDLSSKPTTPVPQSASSNAATSVPSTPSGNTTLNSSSSTTGTSSSTKNGEPTPKKERPDLSPPKNLLQDDEDEEEDMDEGPNEVSDAAEFSGDEEEEDDDNDLENEIENEIIDKTQNAELPENLCTKQENDLRLIDNLNSSSSNNNTTSSTNNNTNNNRNNNMNDNNNRIVLSLKDFRHLNRPPPHHSRPPHLPPPNSHHLNMQLTPPPTHPLSLNSSQHQQQQQQSHHHPQHPHHQPPLGHSVNSLKLESSSEEGREIVERESPFLDQMDQLSLVHHNLLHAGHPMDHLSSLTSKELRDSFKDFKDFKDFASSPMSLPPHFGQPDGHHPNSPLNFPHMSSVSALALTPPHIFGLDTHLGLFPPGMDPGKMYSPLMEMSDPRGGLHPDTPQFLKKKMNRPKGQHSAPRGGPPRSWTNAELTEALQHVWNKKMTTSQASRIFGIPYNSLLMYVRGKYGKSLKLEQLRKDCISGPPIELLTMGMSGNNNNNKSHSSHNQKDMKDDHHPSNLPRSSSSEPDLMSSPTMFNPFPPGFYPDFSSGFPGLPLSVLNLLPPERTHQHPAMQIDEDCKSDRSKQSLEDEYPQPLALNREEPLSLPPPRREIMQHNGGQD